MSTRYDIEEFIDDLTAFLKAKLNTKLSAIDSDKGDGITLSQIADGAYFFQNLAAGIVNYNPFVFIYISTADSDASSSIVDKILNVQVMVIQTDEGNDPNILRKMLRYQRALLELFETYHAQISKLGRIQISNIAPFPMDALANRPGIDQVIGASLRVHIT